MSTGIIFRNNKKNKMRSKLKIPWLLLGVCFFILAGCKKEHIQRTSTTFTLTLTDQPKPGTYTGYFVASGDPTVSGTFSMDVQDLGDSLHCSQTLVVPAKGSTTIISDCSLVTMTGSWYITNGTGAYSNLRGEGSLIMAFPANSPEIEALYGHTWRQ